MADTEKLQATDNLVEKKQQDAQALYDSATSAADNNDWLNEMQSKLNAVPAKKVAQPQEQPSNSAWLNEQQQKLDAAPVKQGGDTAPSKAADDSVEPKKPKTVIAGITADSENEIHDYNKGGVDVDSEGRAVQYVDGKEYRVNEAGDVYHFNDKGDFVKLETDAPAQSAAVRVAPRDTQAAPRFGRQDTWRWTQTIKDIDQNSDLYKDGLNADKYGNLLDSSEVAAIRSNTDRDDLLRQRREIEARWPKRNNSAQYEHDVQLLAAIDNQRVALEYGYANVADMERHIGDAQYKMYADAFRKGNKYFSYYDDMRQNGIDLEVWNPFVGDLPESIKAARKKDRAEGKEWSDNYYYHMALNDKDFEERLQAWSLAYGKQKNMEMSAAKNHAAGYSDRQNAAYMEKDAQRIADSWWGVPYVGFINSGIGEAVTTIMRGWDDKGVDRMYETADRAMQKMSGSQVAFTGVASLGFDALTTLPVGSGAAGLTVKGLLSEAAVEFTPIAMELSPTAARVLVGSLGFANYEASKAILDSTSHGRPLEGAEVVAGWFRGMALGGATSYASSVIGGAFSKVSEKVGGNMLQRAGRATNNWLAGTRGGNYAVRALGKGAEFSIFAGSEIIGELVQGKSLKDIDYKTIALNNGAMIISMSLGHHLASSVTGKTGFGRKISKGQVKRMRDLGYNALADEMETFNNNGFRNKPFGGYSEAAQKELAALRDSMKPGSTVNWSDYAAAMLPTGNLVTQPGVDSASLEKIGDRYVIISRDQNGIEIGRQSYKKESEARKDYDYLKKAVAHNSERANEQSFGMQRGAHIQSEAARAVADALNERAGIPAYNADDTPNPDYMGWTASAANRAFERISNTPAEKRTADDNMLMDMFEKEMERLDKSAVTTADMKKVVCEQYGMTEEAFDKAWNTDADQRTANEKKACDAYNTILSRPYEINTGRKTGEAVLSDGKTVDVVSRIEYDENGNPLPQNIYYKGEDGKIYQVPAENVKSVTETLDTGAAIDKISQANQEAQYNALVEQSRGEIASYTDNQIMEEVFAMMHAIDSGADTDGSLTIRMNILLSEYGRREAEKFNSASDGEKAAMLVEERLPNATEEQKAAISAYYAEHPLELQTAIRYPEIHNSEIKALVDIKGIKESVGWRREYDRYVADEEAFRKDFKKAFSREATAEPYGFERESAPAETAEAAPGESPSKPQSAPQADVDDISAIVDRLFPHATAEDRAEYIRHFVEHPDELDKARANLQILDKNPARDENPGKAAQPQQPENETPTETPTETPKPKPESESESESEEVNTVPPNGALAPQDETPATPVQEKKPAAEAPPKEKIDELLDFLGMEKDDPIARKVFTDDPDYFNEEWTAYQQEKAKKAAEEAAKKDDAVDDSPQEPEIVDDINAPMPTKTVKGKQKVDYSKTTPRRGYHNIYNERGLSTESADKIVKNSIKAAEDAIKAHAKKKPKEGTAEDIDEWLEKNAAWEQENARLEAEKKYWEEVQNISDLTKDIKEIEEAKTFTSRRDVFNKMRSKYATDPAMRAYSDVRRFVPQNLYDACVHYLTSGVRFVWDAEGSKRGLQQQTGWGEAERKKLVAMLSKDGVTPEKAVHEIVDAYGADLGIDLSMSQEILNTLLDAINSTGSVGAAHDYIRTKLLEQMRNELTRRIDGEARDAYDTDADRYYDEQVQQYRDEHPELEGATDEEVIAAMERESNAGEEERVESGENSNGTISDETGVNDDFFEGGEDEYVPFRDGEEENMSADDVEKAIQKAKDNAEKIPEPIDFNKENWDKAFPQARVSTPLGDVKIGENQFEKMSIKGRSAEIGLMKATLERPDFVIEENSPQEGAERQSKYLFVKTFIKGDGSTYRHYESVTIQQEGKEISISSHYIGENKLRDALINDRVLYNKNSSSSNGSENRLAETQDGRSDLLPTPDENESLSDNKDTTVSSNVQENGGKTTESGGEQRFKVGNTWYGRDKTYGVGKKIGGRVYVHKDYAERVVPKDVLDKAKAVAEKEGFSYNCINYDPKNPNVVRFDEAPDFDTAREPITGRFIYVDANTGEVIKTGSSNQIWHHKWQWVAPDYKGFDVQKSYEWSKEWTQKMTHPSGYRDKWDAALREAGLPVDGEGGELYRTSEELNEQYPTWLSGQTKESGKHSTQIPGTLSSYNRIGDWMKKNGMEGASVLDASSGLGYGTRALREQGFNVDDVEPYPDKSREAPTYSKYEDIDKEYDVVISNAVLNVIPDDWRADVLKSMADKLKVGGKLIINVRNAKSIENQKQKIELDSPSEILVTDKKGNITAYQKGFTKKELQDWVKSELGEGWQVDIANEKNSGLGGSTVAVVVTRGEGAAPVRYRSFEPIGERGVKKVTQVREPEYREATDYFGKPATIQTRSAEYKVEGMDDTFRSVEEAADAVRRRNPDYCVYIDNEGNIRLEAWSNLLPEGVKPNSFAKVIAMSGGDMSNAMKKRIANYAKREMSQARKDAEALTQQLGLDVEFHDDPSEFAGRKAKAKGWYDPKTGKIHVVMGNHSGVGDVMATMLHEGVAHHGLRKMFGSDFDTFLDNVHDNVGEEIRAEIDGRIDKMRAAAEKNGESHSDDYYRRAATEEYIAELSEDGLYNAEKNSSYAMRAWEWIKENFLNMLRKAGYKGEISDDELRYILWKSHQNLRQSAAEMAKDAVLKDKAGIKDYVEEGEPVKSVAEGEVRDNVSQHEDNIFAGEGLYRDGEGDAAPANDLAARMRERMRERMERARAEMAANNGGGEQRNANSTEGAEPRTATGGAGNGAGTTPQQPTSSQSPSQPQQPSRPTPTPPSGGNTPPPSGSRINDPNLTPQDRATARDHYEKVMQSSRFQVTEAFQDSMLSLKKLMQAIIGGKKFRIENIAGHENPYLAENRLSSSNNAQRHDFQMKYMNPLFDAIAKIVRPSFFSSKKKARAELSDYMMAKHGLERNEKLAERDARKAADKGADFMTEYQNNRKRDYSGLTALTGESDVARAEAAARQMVQDYESQHDTTELWDRVKAATRATLDKMRESGLLSQENYDSITQMFENYIPLQGWDEKTNRDVYGFLTSHDGPLGSPIKKAKGRSSKADDPIAVIWQMSDQAIQEGNRNLMKQTFLNFVRNHPSDAVSLSDLWLKRNDVTDTWEPVFADIRPDDTPADVARKVETFNQKMEQLAQQYPDVYKRGEDAVNIPYKVVPGSIGEHQVVVKENGRSYVLTINGNPRAAQALNGKTNPDNPGGWVGSFLNGIMKFNRSLSYLYTSANPAFVGSNWVRDAIYSNSMSWVVKDSPNYAAQFSLEWGKLNPVYMRKLYHGWQNGALDTSKKYGRLFEEFMLNGGETGYMSSKEIQKYKRDIKKEVRRAGSDSRKVMHIFGRQLEMANRAVENNARFAAYCASRNIGRSVERSINDAKEVSVNFNKKGAGGRMIGATGQTIAGNVAAFVGGAGRSLYVFWNPAIQGLTNIGRAYRRAPARAIMHAASLFGMGMAAAWLNQNAPWIDDEDREEYYNMPDYVRRSNFCLPLGDKKFISVPLAPEMRAIYGLGELATSVLSGNERYSDAELAYTIASLASQTLPLDMLEGGGGASPFIPNSVKPFYEAGKNKSWTGLPIYKDTPWNKDDPEWKKAYKNTNTWLVEGSKEWNELLGGDDYLKNEWLDINPAQVEYVFRGYGGGFFEVADKLTKMTETFFGDRDFDWSNMLVANRFVKQSDDRTELRKLNNEYYKYQGEYEKTKKLLSNYKDEANGGEPERALKYAEKIGFMHDSKEYGRYLIYEKYAKEFDELNEVRKGVENGTLPASMKQEYENREIELKRQLVQEMHDFEDGIKKAQPKRPSVEEMMEPEKLKKKQKIMNRVKSYEELKAYNTFSKNVEGFESGNNKVIADFQELGAKCKYKTRATKHEPSRELSIEEGGWDWPKDAKKAAKCEAYYDAHKEELERAWRCRWRNHEIERLMDEADADPSKAEENYKKIFQLVKEDQADTLKK